MEASETSNKRSIPSMLYALASFTPWIIYWILCGMGNEFGITIPLAISLFLLVLEIHAKDVSLMDLTSAIYFTIAFTGVCMLNQSVFIEESSFLGYLTLFIMAMLSLAIKRPFTIHFSKREYPPIYWRDKSFIAINSAITAVWTLIFIVNALAFLYLPMPLIISNILIVVGMIFSTIFPVKAPAYYITREYRKYDWRVKVDLSKPKGENEYDVIIVGSGIGGLACGALLAKRGYKVLVLEQHYQVGGYCSSFQRKGFTFNTGVEDVSGLWEKGPITNLLKELGLKKEDLFVKNTIRYIFKGQEIDANSLEEFIEQLSKMFPDENIQAFFDEAEKAYRECYREAEVAGVPLPPYLLVKLFGEKKLLNYPREHPHFYDWMNKTYKEKLDEHFKSEDLKKLLCALIGYLGTKPEETPASSALTAAVSYYIHGGYYPKGGAQHFANTLKNVIEGQGGKVLTRHKVDKILVENGEVKGVKVGDKTFKSSIVVANVNAKTLFLELIDQRHLDRKFIEYIKSLKMSPSAFMVFLGVDMDLSNYPTLIHNLDEGYGITINSNADSALAPKGKASLTIIILANYNNFPPRNTKEYKKLKEKLAQQLIKKAEKVIPNLSKHVTVQDTATPKTFERYTSMPQGAIYAFHQSKETKRPHYKTPIKGLYLSSASTFPGAGIEAVTIAATICANDITNWKHRCPLNTPCKITCSETKNTNSHQTKL